MLERLTDEEIQFCECLYDPIAFQECAFSDFENLVLFEEESFAHVRLGQFPLMSYEYIIAEDPKLSDKENFQLQAGAGDCFCYGGRKFGKTLFVEITDLLMAMMLNNGQECGFSSYDALHIRGILEKVIQVLLMHPLFKILEARINRSPSYRLHTKTGFTVDGVNMNLSGENPGAQFFQKHFARLYMEEASFETEEVYHKRIDSVSENGCIYRISGMTNFTKHSPPGRIFYDTTKQNWIVNLPQYVSPKWDKKEKEDAIRKHGGEESIDYKMYVKGVVVEEGISVFDMQRIRPYYNDKRILKHFEITKDTFEDFRRRIIVERPTNAESAWLCSDIGETAPSELIILFEVNGKYRYTYNITLHGLTDKEQKEVHGYVAELIRANIISLDTTDGLGRAIFRGLAETISKENLVWVAFNEKINVDFERDVNNNILYEDGQPVYKQELIDSWSIKRLKDLLYDQKIELPLDYKLDTQLNSVISAISGARTVYTCLASEDHLLAAFRVFAIAQWQYELNCVQPIRTKKWCKTGV